MKITKSQLKQIIKEELESVLAEQGVTYRIVTKKGDEEISRGKTCLPGREASAEMHKLKGGIKIIDTPGIKGFGIVEMQPQEIGNYFPEFFQRKDKCKFNNCLHQNEPNCAIKSAVEEGLIAQSRFNSYTQILSEDSNYRN